MIYNLSTFKLGPWLVKRYQKYAELLHANYQAKGRPYEDTRRFTLYLSDPIVRTLIDLPCLYAVKDNFDIVTDDDSLREEVVEMFRDINDKNISIKTNKNFFNIGLNERK